MNTNTRKTFFLVEGGKAAAAAQDAKFDGFNNVLVYARTAFEARVIAEAYADEQIGIDNVEADNGKDVISAVFAPSDEALNEWIANYGKTILAADLLELVAAKGCIQVTGGVYVQTAQNLIAEQVTWGPEDLSADSDFSVAPFWITTDSGDDPVPVDGADDSELAALVAENSEEIAKILEVHRTDGVTLCEVDTDKWKFTVVA